MLSKLACIFISKTKKLDTVLFSFVKYLYLLFKKTPESQAMSSGISSKLMKPNQILKATFAAVKYTSLHLAYFVVKGHY